MARVASAALPQMVEMQAMTAEKKKEKEVPHGRDARDAAAAHFWWQMCMPATVSPASRNGK
jgi:hypothetical protein